MPNYLKKKKVITGLKKLDLEMEFPYQTLMHKFITEDLSQYKKSA